MICYSFPIFFKNENITSLLIKFIKALALKITCFNLLIFFLFKASVYDITLFLNRIQNHYIS